MFNPNQSDFTSGGPGAAWFTRTTSQPNRIYAWQGRRFYRAFKEALAYRTQGMTGPTGRVITLSPEPTTIALSDLARFQTWIEGQATSPEAGASLLPADLLAAVTDAVRTGRMTSGAMRAILWFTMSGGENIRYEEIQLPNNVIFPALGVAPETDPNGLPAMIFWNANEQPPASVRTDVATSGGEGGSQPVTGTPGWVIGLAIAIPVVLGVLVAVWVYMSKKKSPQLPGGSARELSERYGSLYRRESKK